MLGVKDLAKGGQGRLVIYTEQAIKELGEKLIEGLGKNFTFKKIGYTLVVQKWRKAKR